MSEPAESNTEERTEDAQPTEQPEESKAEQEKDDGANQNEADAEPTIEESEAQQELVSSEKETVNETQGSTGDDVQDEKQESAQAEVENNDNEKVPVEEGDPIDKEELNSKIQENEDLSLKLESTLSNQEAEKDAYKKLTEENASLQKRHDDMKEKFDDMEGGHVLLVAEVETLRKVNGEQKEAIVKLESENKMLRDTQGGDENVKDMQEKLIRMASEQEEKDKRIHSLEGELDTTREQLKDAESRAARGGNNSVQNSKTCVIM